MSQHLYVPLAVIAILVLGAILLAARASKGRREGREKFIREYAFPAIVRERVRRLHPEWSREELESALQALREFFLLCLAARGTIVQMTSKAADDAWHEFIVCTREYRTFCRRAFGRFLHHKPEPGGWAADSAAGAGFFACAAISGDGHHGHHGHGDSGSHGHGCSAGGCSGSCGGGGGCSSS